MKKIFYTLTVFLAFHSAQAQQSLTLYNMNSIGQSSQINASLLPQNGSYIGVPALGSISFMFTNSGFTWRDLHRVQKDDSVKLDIENAISKLAEKNFISLSIRASIFEAGFHVKENYFTINIAEKANLNFTFPKELFELLLKGNGSFIGQEIDLKQMAFDATHYREYGIGFARPVNEKITVGTRLKYLYGMENYSSAKSNLSFYTAPDDYSIQLKSSYVINTSSSANAENGSNQNYMFGMKNTGFAMDFSTTYKSSEKWTFNASVVDLGYIRWKSNVKNLVTAEGSYTFSGLDINQFMSDSSSGFDGVLDSISDAFNPEVNHDSYKTNLPAHFYANAIYSINQKTSVSALIHAQTFRGSLQPSFTAALDREVSKHISGCLTYSVINHHFDNAGAGLSMRAGPLQFFMISDNLIGTINPLSNHTTHIQFGFNLVYGRNREHKGSTDYGVKEKEKSDKKDSSLNQEAPDDDLKKAEEKSEKK